MSYADDNSYYDTDKIPEGVTSKLQEEAKKIIDLQKNKRNLIQTTAIYF